MVLAMSAGALRKLLLRYDGQADHPLLASVPVSFDFSPRADLGQLLHRRPDGAAGAGSTIRWSGCAPPTTPR